MKVTSLKFWQDLKQSIQGLDGLAVTRALIIVEPQQPVMLHIQMLVDTISEGRLLTKTYEIREVKTEEADTFLSADLNENRETPHLSSLAEEWVKAAAPRSGERK